MEERRLGGRMSEANKRRFRPSLQKRPPPASGLRTAGEASMPAQRIRAFRRESRVSGAFAALLAFMLLLAAGDGASRPAAAAAQKGDREAAARKAFEEGERLRERATPDSLREAVG